MKKQQKFIRSKLSSAVAVACFGFAATAMVPGTAWGACTAGDSSGCDMDASESFTLLDGETVSNGGGHAISVAEGIQAASITNNDGGTISSVGSGISISTDLDPVGSGDALTGLTGDLNNAGTISSTGTHGIYLDSLNGGGIEIGGSLINSGTVEGGGFGTSGINIDKSNIVGDFINSGTVEGVTAITISQFSTIGGGLINTGVIEGTGGSAITFGVGVTTPIDIEAASPTARIIGDVTATGSTVTVDTGGGFFVTEGDFDVDQFDVLSNGLQISGGDTITIGNAAADAFSNSGTVKVADGDTGNVVGNYTQDAGATFHVGVNDSASTSGGTLAISGNAVLYGSIYVELTDDTTAPTPTFLADEVPVTVTIEDIITVTGTLDSTALVTGNSVSSNYAGDGSVTFLIIDDGASNIDLQVTYNPSLCDTLPNSGTDMDIGGVSGALTSVGAGNVHDDVCGARNIPLALANVVPVLNGGVANLTLQTIGSLRNIIENRFDSLTFSSGFDKFDLDRFKDDNQSFFNKDALGKITWWFKPYGRIADQDDNNGIAGYDYNTWGISAGGDAFVSSDWRVGGGLSYSETDVNLNSSYTDHDVDVDTFQAGVYAIKYLAPDLRLNLQAIAGKTNYDHVRNIRFPTDSGTINDPFVNKDAYGDYDGHHFAGSVALEKDYGISEDSMVRARAFADYTYVSVEDYTETNADEYNLKVYSDNENSLILGLGGAFKHMPSDNDVLTLRGSIGYDTLADRGSVEARFANQTETFTTYDVDVEPFLVRAGIGYELKPKNQDMIIDARYDAEVRDGFDEHVFSIKFKMEF